jgi:hypothetical protein
VFSMDDTGRVNDDHYGSCVDGSGLSRFFCMSQRWS